MTISGIVLAGGRSSRFGASKLDADLGGRTVLARTIDALAPVCDAVIVVGRHGDPGKVSFIEDQRPFEGPLVALAAALARSSGQLAVAVGGDMPILRAALLRSMLRRLAVDPGVDLVVLEGDGRPHALPMALRVAPTAAAIAQLLGGRERSLRSLIGVVASLAISETEWRALDPNADTLLDVDVPADLEIARARLTSGRTRESRA